MKIPGPVQEPTAAVASLEQLKGRTDPAAVKAVAQEMEALFALELLKAMRATTGPMAGKGLGADMYGSMFDMELSKLIAKRGLGLQDMMTKSINRKLSSEQNGVSAPVSLENLTSSKKSQPLPVQGGKISSPYGMRNDPFTGNPAFHQGLDVTAPEGSEIKPLKQGTVKFSGKQKGYGNIVVVDHGGGFVSKYAHNQKNMVKTGDTVTNNTVIAHVGATGRSTGPHTHVEIQYRNKSIDPALIFAKKS
ncbi:MAG: M23 family metallopeptidase [Nitrospirota bacterium]